MAFLIIKSLHIIGVITWFAGLFYIFRLYVYHVENQGKDEITNVLKVMERRLYYYITWPSMVLTTAMGIALIVIYPSLLNLHWLQIKLGVLVFLFLYHFYSGHVLKEFAKGNYILTSKQCRLINEVPTIILLITIPLAIIKPF